MFTRVRLSQELPPVTLYEIKTDSPEMAASLNDNLPLISTLKPPEDVVPLQETSMVGVACGGDGVGVGVGEGVDVGSGVGVGSGVDAGAGVGSGVVSAAYLNVILIILPSSPVNICP